jgi:N-acetylglucosamine malate deacetylase 1
MSTLKQLIKNLRCKFRWFRLTRRIPFAKISTLSTVIIAPHPDDETFGAGGLIAIKKKAGISVKVIFLTMGEASHKWCCNISPEELIKERRKQAISACQTLGLEANDLIWLNLRDGNIPKNGELGFDKAVFMLKEELIILSPEEIYCPHPFDGLRDHEATNQVVNVAVKSAITSTRIIYYLVWAWFNSPSLNHNCFEFEKAWKINIDSVHARKLAAIECFLNSPFAPCGQPFCGKLPSALIWCLAQDSEVFFEA